ncbi:aminopeptidase N-like [Anoplolepis gracilipes]|uniref:aminopeptidase N-like n=1 Tax=Anoplolepis gracilipes TaxID=354296 RepID=UPI003B9FB6E1
MGGLTLLLSGILTFVAPTVYSNNTDELIPLNNIIPEHYNIKLILRIEENVFFGECDIYIKILNETEQIRMSAEKLAIVQAILIKNDGSSNLIKVVGNTYDSEKNILILYFKNKLPPGHYILSLRYSSFFKRSFSQILDFPSSNEKEVLWLSATHFQPIWVQRIFPCWNSSNSTFNISIKHSKMYKTLSNSAIRAMDLHEDDMQWTYFDSTPTMSPYQVSIVLINFVRYLIFKDDIVMWCRKNSTSYLQFAMLVTKDITFYLRTKWNRLLLPYVKYIVIPDFKEQKDSLVNLGIVIYNERDIIHNEESYEVQHKYRVMLLIGYKIVREWFESIHNTQLWSNSVSNKGFAIFFAMEVIQQIVPYSWMTNFFVVQVQHEWMNFEDDNKMLPTYRGNIPVEILNNHIKVSLIYRMLQLAFGKKTFEQAFRTYLYEKSHIKNKTIKIDQEKGAYDVALMLEFWTKHVGCPLLNVSRDYDTNKINISLMNIDIWSEKRPIPLIFTSQLHNNFKRTRPFRWFYRQNPFKPYNTSFMHKLNHKEDGWIIFNIQQAAYYRTLYDYENWRRIAVYLNYAEFWKIHILNRAAIIDDTFHLTLLGKIDQDVFWKITRYLHREGNYTVWYPMFKAIELMSSTFPLHEDSSRIRFLKNILNNLLETLFYILEYEEDLFTDDSFTKALKQEGVKWMCFLERTFGKTNCNKRANNQLKQHLKNRTNLSPWWKKWTYCYGLIIADNTIWNQVLNKIREDNDNILYFLNCPNYLAGINKFVLTFIKKNVESFSEQSIYYNRSDVNSTIFQFELKYFVSTISNAMEDDERFENLLNKFLEIKPSQLKLSTALIILINHTYSNEYLGKIYKHEYNLALDEIYKIHSKIRIRLIQIHHLHINLFNRIQPSYEYYYDIL